MDDIYFAKNALDRVKVEGLGMAESVQVVMFEISAVKSSPELQNMFIKHHKLRIVKRPRLRQWKVRAQIWSKSLGAMVKTEVRPAAHIPLICSQLNFWGLSFSRISKLSYCCPKRDPERV